MHNYSGCFEESGKIPGSFAISWEQRKLENILSLENGFAFQSEYFVEEKTGYVVATPGNVSVEGGFICEGGKNYSVSAPFNERFIFKSGDIFVTMTDLTPTANTLGKPAIVPDNGIIYLHNQRLGKLVDYNCNKKFLFALLCTDKYHSQIVKTASGTTVRHSSPDKILSYETFVPKFEEQKMIGKFFSNLDHFIALHQRKQCILYIMEKLLCGKSKQLEKSISWEQRKLGNMMDVTSVKRIHQSDWTDSGVRFLRARDIVAESKNEEVSEPIFISQEKYDEYSAVSGKVEKGDLLVTGVGTIGVPMLINSEEPLYFKDGNIIWFKNKNAIDGRFFYHSFKGLNIQKFIKESAGTGTVGTYTIENGKKTPINLPLQKEEQEKIGEYFSNLDNLIALHQRKP